MNMCHYVIERPFSTIDWHRPGQCNFFKSAIRKVKIDDVFYFCPLLNGIAPCAMSTIIIIELN